MGSQGLVTRCRRDRGDRRGCLKAEDDPAMACLINGTIIYIVLGVVAGFCQMFVSKNNKPLYMVSVVLTTVCTWLLWACCYMSQMYPILYPMLSEAPAAHGGDHAVG